MSITGIRAIVTTQQECRVDRIGALNLLLIIKKKKLKKLNLLLIFWVCILQSCTTDDCGNCFTPPESFRFEIVDKMSGENLFTNGTYDLLDIEITNVLDGTSADFRFISENNVNLIQIDGIGFQTEIVNLNVAVGTTPIFSFFVNAERKNEDCCNITTYNDIGINGQAYVLDAQTGVYKILVD